MDVHFDEYDPLQLSMIEDDEDDNEWIYHSSDRDTVLAETLPVKASCAIRKRSVPGTLRQAPMKVPSHRIVLHFDLDCFYAQVEMIRNPELRNTPLGIQQKSIVVTCNYVARECGVTKLMSLRDAKERCPQLVLVSGEDLTHYREISYKVTELLERHCPLVERLGFDENFMDVTDMVEAKLKLEPLDSDFSVSGHIYNQQSLDTGAEDHRRLAVGSHIAAQLRAALHAKLGLTGCAGVATSKLLAKLVSGTFKPNQQTTLLPESIAELMSSQTGLRKVPGIGHRTAQRLQALGLSSVRDLQCFPLAALEKEFGGVVAQRLHSLSLGLDEAPVTPSGPPQSLSDEDSFKKVSTETEVSEKIKELLCSLLDRMHKDGRQPGTIRLTIRRFSATNKWFSRESRQCPIPNPIGKKILSGSQDAETSLVIIALKLFRKMIEKNTPFHLTLINVCFCNLQARGTTSKGSIQSFFTQRSPEKAEFQEQSRLGYTVVNTSLGDPELVCGIETVMSDSKPPRTRPVSPPPGVDPTMFLQLPDYIQRELRSNAPPAASPGPPWQKTHTITAPDQAEQAWMFQQHPLSRENLECEFKDSFAHLHWDVGEVDIDSRHNQPRAQMAHNKREPSGLQCSFRDEAAGEKCGDEIALKAKPEFDFPPNVDPRVFSELPAELQRELLSEWRQQKPVSKIPATKTLGRNRPAKETKNTTAKSTQANNLLKYFKPC
ncbi:hypothetical protein AAFF_G00426090 [Aldrovandia affinis]|uniref:UmuC domain-containing protein n=1 Tax=Aldrovandia affinis TaxID=143900 RepID=A0AAD7T703_9TELE|nr:hypothetical protein AAFF_G00426090 [Aldrovandia affinis]